MPDIQMITDCVWDTSDSQFLNWFNKIIDVDTGKDRFWRSMCAFVGQILDEEFIHCCSLRDMIARVALPDEKIVLVKHDSLRYVLSQGINVISVCHASYDNLGTLSQGIYDYIFSKKDTPQYIPVVFYGFDKDVIFGIAYGENECTKINVQEDKLCFFSTLFSLPRFSDNCQSDKVRAFPDEMNHT